jgi:hypothetical protein
MERFLSVHLRDETGIDFKRYAEKKVRDCELQYTEYVFLGGAAEDQVHIGKSKTGP